MPVQWSSVSIVTVSRVGENGFDSMQGQDSFSLDHRCAEVDSGTHQMGSDQSSPFDWGGEPVRLLGGKFDEFHLVPKQCPLSFVFTKIPFRNMLAIVWSVSTRLHNATSQKTPIFIFLAVTPSNFTKNSFISANRRVWPIQNAFDMAVLVQCDGMQPVGTELSPANGLTMCSHSVNMETM